ncbi:DNA starvation/stationary phase protection protein [Boudabousia liubingyangii]|uniref:DNA starvation/stationary phase protection protein n=1 Tax=Boudabousia liubingyangii TaxID=1921764 RepID=A0A1Q5PN14_9ACTO|nr:DNA starvation/stationary phase protection protein [Boudabousia liubingyangii]OKL47527.1 DNA starvation/stationary phase protection protein [Boudabousia liubingyangii]OKL48951.1 DNA starvation/stationary phase protection protein [Boudabousia liubingyangii]
MAANAAVATAMQQAVVDLNALALQGKQLHWNLQGKNFLSLHEQLDLVVDFARTSYDEFAERLVAVGGSPDARANTIAEQSVLSPLPEGYIMVDDAYKIFEAALMDVAKEMIKHIDAVDAVDHLSADLLISTARELEKTAWMLRAEMGRLG